MSVKNDFCPECSTLLHPEEIFSDNEDSNEDETEEKTPSGGLYLVCGECSYREKTESFTAHHFSKKIEKIQYVHPKRIVEDYIYDMTFPRTRSKVCSNKECPSQGKENPIIVLITSENHPEIAYLCTDCKYIWGKI